MIMIAGGALVSLIHTETSQMFFGVLWLFVFFSGWAILKYFRLSWWEEKMIKKYPLTRSVQLSKEKNEKVLWWNDKTARPVLMIFWSGIIPLLCILKYVLHLF